MKPCLGTSSFQPACLLSCGEAHFPWLLYAPLLEILEQHSYLSGSLANLSLTRGLGIMDPYHMPQNSLQGLQPVGVHRMTFVTILNPKTFRFPVLISTQAVCLPYYSANWELGGLEVLGLCSQDRLKDGLWVPEALACTKFPPLWLFSATHSSKTDQNYVGLHQSAKCSLQHSSFWIYHISCGFGFCQKWRIILPSSFLQPQRKH